MLFRYASPSRSPVNKPDQKYDPNYRRAHSFQDVSVHERDSETTDPSDENAEAENDNTECPSHRCRSPTASNRNQMADQPCERPPENKIISFRIKELLLEEPSCQQVASSKGLEKPPPILNTSRNQSRINVEKGSSRCMASSDGENKSSSPGT